MYQTLGMVAGGTSIAPMLQVIDEVLNNPHDTTKIHLVYGNVSDQDIILKDRVDALTPSNCKSLML